MATEGWFRVHRKIVDSQVFSDPALLKTWIWCLARANYRTRYHKGEAIPPGSFATGRVAAAEALGVSPSTALRHLRKLRDLGQIDIEVDTRFSVVTICNWATYQNAEGEGWTSSETTSDTSNETSSETTDDTTGGHNRRRKEGKKERREEINHPVSQATPGGYPPEFEEFWRAYPSRRKRGKADALKRWKQAVKQVDPETLIAKAREYAESDVGSGEYACLPATWLNQARWDDAPESWTEPQSGANGSRRVSIIDELREGKL